MNRQYIVYGIEQSEFDKDKVTPISNRRFPDSKPFGGLWASPIVSDWGWRDFCIAEGYRVEDLDRCTVFHLEENAKIFRVSNRASMQRLLDRYGMPSHPELPRISIDFEKLKKDYDALYATDKGCDYLPRWDVESIIILNPNKIRIDDRDKSLMPTLKEETLKKLQNYRDKYDDYDIDR